MGRGIVPEICGHCDDCGDISLLGTGKGVRLLLFESRSRVDVAVEDEKVMSM